MIYKLLSFFFILTLPLHSFAEELSLNFKPVINLSVAKKMADACEKDQERNGYNPVNIAIVDSGGDLYYDWQLGNWGSAKGATVFYKVPKNYRPLTRILNYPEESVS